MQNSKKCLRVDVQSSLIASLVLSQCGLFLLNPASSWAVPPQNKKLQIYQQIRKELKQHQKTHFGSLIEKWKKAYGPSATEALVQIAQQKKKHSESQRYIALMAAARLGGEALIPQLETFYSDPSWMLRSAALRILSTLGKPQDAEKAIGLLQDPALAVRVEAVDVIQHLKPKGSADALLATLKDPSNYHKGRAIWVPQKALKALSQFSNKEIKETLEDLRTSEISRLASKDPDLQRLADQVLKGLN